MKDPFLGPKGIRSLLLLRGFSGQADPPWGFYGDIESGNFRFIGLSGLYLSLQYLSLSDATVLTFLTPVCTVFTGAVFLGESFAHRQAFAGRKYFHAS